MNKYYFLIDIGWFSYYNENKYDFNKKINSSILLNFIISDEVNKLLITYNI